MPDPRFFPVPDPVTLEQAARLTGARLSDGADPAQRITSVAPVDSAGPGDAAFLASPSDTARLDASRAGACFVTPALAAKHPGGRALLIHDAPQRAFVALARHLFPEPPLQPGISPAAHVADGALVGAGCRIDPGAVIEDGAEIGAGSWIRAGSVICENVVIGEGARIGPNATITHAILGAGVIVHAGAAIGQDGFGYVPGPAGLVKVPQLGRVLIGDDVEIGANTTIDRGAGGDTEIGQGTKIDNQVQIGHNCRIGRFCALASQVGLSGSVTVGDGVQMGGKSGSADHITIGAGAKLAAGTGLMRDVPPGAVMAGRPALPIKDWHRDTVNLKRLRDRRPTKDKDQ